MSYTAILIAYAVALVALGLFLSRRVFDFLAGTGFQEDLDDVFRKLEVTLRSKESLAVRNLDRKVFDVNDVSILLPLQKTAGGTVPYPQIRVSGVAPPGADAAPAAEQLWSNEVWTQVVAEAQRQGIKSGESGGSDFFKLRGLWHIAAMRFDPCAPGLSDAARAVTAPAPRS